MKKPFPLFVDLEATPPLVIGNADILLAKVRLLLKFAPVVEVITDSETLSIGDVGQGVKQRPNVGCATAHDHIQGRPLVMVETLDDRLNASLATRARHLGVPVNVPDNPMLSGVYLGSIVDRAPLTVAISSSGVAPVLGQNLRARIEDMLPAVAQGAIGIACRTGDETMQKYLAGLNHEDTRLAVVCERAFLAALDGSCRTPIAGYARKGEDGKLHFNGLVATTDGKEILTSSGTADFTEEGAVKLGQECGDDIKGRAREGFFMW